MIGANTGDPRVQRLLDQLELKYQIGGEGDFKVIFNIGDGRSQLGFISSKAYTLSTLEIREIYSFGYECDGPLPASVANILLRLNGHVKLGAWRVMRLASGRHLAAFAAQIAANTDAHTLRTTLVSVLKTADDLEKELSGDDIF
ncbi:MAG: hypothetical protein WCS99_13945 [Limisphaerales bacterium]